VTIHHIGYLVKRIDKAIKVFQSLGYGGGGKLFTMILEKLTCAFWKKTDMLLN